MTLKHSKWSLKYANIFHSNALQNVPKLGLWFENKPSGNPAWSVKHAANF
jgi:hypothetical protein